MSGQAGRNKMPKPGDLSVLGLRPDDDVTVRDRRQLSSARCCERFGVDRRFGIRIPMHPPGRGERRVVGSEHDRVGEGDASPAGAFHPVSEANDREEVLLGKDEAAVLGLVAGLPGGDDLCPELREAIA
jgi:hypothetical protein